VNEVSNELAVSSEHGYLRMLAVVFALSGIVFIEPAPFDILILIAAAIGLLGSYMRTSRQIGRPVVWLWVFLLCNLVSMYFMTDVRQGVVFLLITIYLFVLWFFLAGIVNRWQGAVLGGLFHGYVAASLLSALMGFVVYFRLIPSADVFMTDDRIRGFFKDPNVFGPFLIPVALYAIAKLETPGAVRKGWWAAVWLMTSSAVFLSYSRAAWVNYGVSLGVLLIFFFWHANNSREAIRKLTIVFSVGVLLLVLFVTLFDVLQVNQMFAERFRLQGYDEDRFATQKIAFASLLEHPLGIGPGQAETVFDYSTHSLYARVFSENGILGGIAFLSFLAVTYWRSLRLAFQQSPYQHFFIVCAASLIGILVNSLVVDTLHWRHFWVLLAIPWADYLQSSTARDK
jgi:hypothetical protein